MSSDEMRIELESFVNKGLKEGWCGWPLKSQPTLAGSGQPVSSEKMNVECVGVV